MNLEKYICELLYKNDCVIIPNFGGFLLHPTPSFRSKQNQAFNPPSKLLAFNEQLNQNDGVLVNHLMAALSINYETALHHIDSYEKSIKEELRKKEVYDFETIGKFYYSQKGLLQFTPNSSNNYHRDSFGLFPIHATPIIRFDEKEIEIYKNIEVKKLKKETVKEKSLNLKLITQVAAAIILLLTMTWQFKTYNLSYKDLSMENIENIQVSNVIENLLQNDLHINEEKLLKFSSKDREETANSDDELLALKKKELANLEKEYKEINKKIKEVKTEFNKEINPKLKNKVPVEITKNNFGAIYIIVGSFKDISNANKLAVKLKKKGYSITTLEAENGYIRVGIYDFYSVEEAKLTLNKIKENVTSSAWIAEAESMF